MLVRLKERERDKRAALAHGETAPIPAQVRDQGNAERFVVTLLQRPAERGAEVRARVTDVMFPLRGRLDQIGRIEAFGEMQCVRGVPRAQSFVFATLT